MIGIGADHNLTYSGAVDATDGTTYLNTGTCTYAITDNNGTLVVGGSGTLAYVTASNGNYRGIVDGAVTATLTNGANYTITITFVQGNYNDVRQWQESAGYRGMAA